MKKQNGEIPINHLMGLTGLRLSRTEIKKFTKDG